MAHHLTESGSGCPLGLLPLLGNFPVVFAVAGGADALAQLLDVGVEGGAPQQPVVGGVADVGQIVLVGLLADQAKQVGLRGLGDQLNKGMSYQFLLLFRDLSGLVGMVVQKFRALLLYFGLSKRSSTISAGSRKEGVKNLWSRLKVGSTEKHGEWPSRGAHGAGQKLTLTSSAPSLAAILLKRNTQPLLPGVGSKGYAWVFLCFSCIKIIIKTNMSSI